MRPVRSASAAKQFQQERECDQRILAALRDENTSWDRFVTIHEALPRSCEWLRAHPKFILWANSDHHACLCLVTGAAKGKSTISKHIVTQLIPEMDEEAVICWFFANARGQVVTACSILRKLLGDLFMQKPSLIQTFRLELERCGQNLLSNFNALRQIWSVAVLSPGIGSVYVMVEALDELRTESREKVFDVIRSVLGRSSVDHAVKFFVTTRTNVKLQSYLDLGRPSTEHSGYIDAEQGVDREDLSRAPELYLAHFMEELRSSGQSEDSARLLVNEMKTPQTPSYLHLHLMANGLRQRIHDCDTLSSMLKGLRCLSTDMKGLYHQSLSSSPDMKLARRVLLLLSARSGEQPVTDMRIALASRLEVELKSTSDATKDTSAELLGGPQDLQDFTRHLGYVCGPLIQIGDMTDDELGTHDDRLSQAEGRSRTGHVMQRLPGMYGGQSQMIIRFGHGDVKEYLEYIEASSDPFPFSMSEAHTLMARAIINFLLRVKRLATDAQGNFQSSLLPPAATSFFRYSVVRWTYHLNEIDLSTNSSQELAFSTCSIDFQTIAQTNSKHLYRPSTDASPLILAAYWGLHKFCKVLASDEETLVNVRDEKMGLTALMIAAQTGAKDIVDILCLRDDLDLDIQNADGDTALMLAIISGNAGIAQELIRQGCNVNIQNNRGLTALMVASSCSEVDIVVHLLGNDDIQVNLVDSKGSCALVASIEGGEQHITCMLLTHQSTKINFTSQSGLSNGMNMVMMCLYRGWTNALRIVLGTESTMNQQMKTIYMLRLIQELPRYKAIHTILLHKLSITKSDDDLGFEAWLRECCSMQKYTWLWLLAMDYMMMGETSQVG